MRITSLLRRELPGNQALADKLASSYCTVAVT